MPPPHRGEERFRRKDPEAQASLWLPAQELPKMAAMSFYQRLDRALAALRDSRIDASVVEAIVEADVRSRAEHDTASLAHRIRRTDRLNERGRAAIEAARTLLTSEARSRVDAKAKGARGARLPARPGLWRGTPQ